MVFYVNFNLSGGLLRPHKQGSAVFKKHFCLTVLLFHLSYSLFFCVFVFLSFLFFYAVFLILDAYGSSVTSSTLKIEAVRFSETSVNLYRRYMASYPNRPSILLDLPSTNIANMAAR
jgi:hypothetical protein